MSLWRMYSAREQDQPPSVLLVGTFYKNRQDAGPGVDYLMPRVSQAFLTPKSSPPIYIKAPLEDVFCFWNNSLVSFLLQPLYYTPCHPTYKLPAETAPARVTSASPREKGISARFIQLVQGTTPKPSDSLKAESSAPTGSQAGVSHTPARQQSLPEQRGQEQTEGDSGGKACLGKGVCSKPEVR